MNKTQYNPPNFSKTSQNDVHEIIIYPPPSYLLRPSRDFWHSTEISSSNPCPCNQPNGTRCNLVLLSLSPSETRQRNKDKRRNERRGEGEVLPRSPCFPPVRAHTVQTRIHALCAHCPAFEVESGSATSSLSPPFFLRLFLSFYTTSASFALWWPTRGLPVKAVEIWFTYVIRVSQPPACFHRRNWTVH